MSESGEERKGEKRTFIDKRETGLFLAKAVRIVERMSQKDEAGYNV